MRLVRFDPGSDPAVWHSEYKRGLAAGIACLGIAGGLAIAAAAVLGGASSGNEISSGIEGIVLLGTGGLFFAIGAAGEKSKPERVYDAIDSGVLAMDAYVFS